MYRSEIHIIKSLHKLYKYCDDICFKSKNLYNYANYLVRQEFIENHNYKTSFDLNKELKTHEAFKALPAKTAQQIIIRLGDNWKAFFKSIKIWTKDKSKYCGQPSLPNYKKKNGRNIVFFDYQQGKWIGNKFYFSCQNELFIETNITKDKFVQCQIVPCGAYYKISIIYKKEVEQRTEQNNNIVAIDLGVNNLATLVNNTGLQPVIINGRIMKSINNFFNKEYAKAQSYVPKESTKRIRRLITKRNNIITTQMHRVSKWIINYCLKNNISNLVIGQLWDWKRNVNLGHKNNQTFVQIPFGKLIQQLQYKGEDVGINVIIVNEEYTSKASFIDNDDFNSDNFSGKRIKRGLYRSKDKILINADINAAYNILRKSNLEFTYENHVKGLALTPIKLDIA